MVTLLRRLSVLTFAVVAATGCSDGNLLGPENQLGSATLRVVDAAGTEVYSRSLSEGGTFQTSAGTTGAWTITVTMDGATGSINFRLETP
jgi:hypothetical protein